MSEEEVTVHKNGMAYNHHHYRQSLLVDSSLIAVVMTPDSGMPLEDCHQSCTEKEMINYH